MSKMKVLTAVLAAALMTACSHSGSDSAPASAAAPTANTAQTPTAPGPSVDFLFQALSQRGAITANGTGFMTVHLVGALSDRDKEAGGGCRALIYVDNAQQTVIIEPDVRQDEDDIETSDIKYKLILSRGDHRIVASPVYEDQHQELISFAGQQQTLSYIDGETRRETSRLNFNFDRTGKLRSFTLQTRHQAPATCELWN